jgi:hypothetical protein
MAAILTGAVSYVKGLNSTGQPTNRIALSGLPVVPDREGRSSIIAAELFLVAS